MKSERATAHRSDAFDEKLQAVLVAGARVIAREGYGNATIRQVALEVGMSLAGLYYYFSSKEELLFLIQHHTFGAILKRLEERLEGVDEPRRRLSVMVANHLEHFLARMDDLRVCARELESLSGHYFEQVEALRHRYFAITLEIVESINSEAGGSRSEPRLATLYLFGMLNWIYMWYPDTDGVSGEEMSEQLLALFLEGYLPR
jgi:AcrR family transcriptional regulator